MKEKEISENGNKVIAKGPKLGVVIVIGVILLILLGMQVYASNKGYGNVFFMLKTIVTGEAHGKDEIFYDNDKEENVAEVAKNTTVDTEVKDKDDSDKKDEDTEIKELAQKYYDLAGAWSGSPDGMLKKLGYSDSEIHLKDAKVVQGSYQFYETSIDFDDFKSKMLEVVTESWYKNAFGRNYTNVDGKLYYSDGGATGMEYIVETMKKLDEDEYDITISWENIDGSKESEVVTLLIKNENGKYVVNGVNTSPEPADDETAKVKASIQRYYDLVGAWYGSPDGMLIKLGYSDSQIHLKDAKIVQGNYQYYETSIDFSDFKTKMLDIMSESWYNNVFKRNYSDIDGKLYYSNGGATGVDYVVESVKKTTEYEYEATITWENVDESKEMEVVPVLVKNVDGKYIIDEADFKDVNTTF